MKTTHQMAAELLALPNVPLVIELWCDGPWCEMVAEMTGYDPEGTAIIWQKPFPHRSNDLTTLNPDGISKESPSNAGDGGIIQ